MVDDLRATRSKSNEQYEMCVYSLGPGQGCAGYVAHQLRRSRSGNRVAESMEAVTTEPAT